MATVTGKPYELPNHKNWVTVNDKYLVDFDDDIKGNTARLKLKFKGQRLGRALWNALGQDTIEQRYKNTDQSWNEIISRRLFYIEDEELGKLLNDYLREL